MTPIISHLWYNFFPSPALIFVHDNAALLRPGFQNSNNNKVKDILVTYVPARQQKLNPDLISHIPLSILVPILPLPRAWSWSCSALIKCPQFLALMSCPMAVACVCSGCGCTEIAFVFRRRPSLLSRKFA